MRFERDAASNQLRVYDNGAGFDAEGAVSVCQQGQSRKQSNKQIGFMGIGFKSLFEVCNRVEIHSKGYHFQFQAGQDSDEDGAPGFLVPEWIDDADKKVPTNGMMKTPTSILLQLSAIYPMPMQSSNHCRRRTYHQVYSCF